MAEPKSTCTSCGCEILQQTADRNGGLCAPCFLHPNRPHGEDLRCNYDLPDAHVLHCPNCRTSIEVNVSELRFHFVRYRQVGSIREYRCPKCDVFIPGRNALGAKSIEEAIERQRKFDELVKE